MKEKLNKLIIKSIELKEKKKELDDEIKFVNNDIIDTLKELGFDNYEIDEAKVSIVKPKASVAFSRPMFKEKFGNVENKNIYTKEAMECFRETEKLPFLKISIKKDKEEE